MKEGKTMVVRSKMKMIALIGLVLSSISIGVHFWLAWFTDDGFADFYQSSFTAFEWRPILQNPLNTPKSTSAHRRLWGPTRALESLLPNANPRGPYPAPPESNGFMFVRIQGGFHEIRNSLCDVVAVARLLNATLVVPEIQSTTSKKGISSQFKSFAYLYDEEHFMVSLSQDVQVVKTLPKDLKGARRKKEIPSFKAMFSTTPFFYLRHVLPVLKKHSVVELVVADGGCLQAVLPSDLEEYQRLRCRVAFHALQFRREVHELANGILGRLREHGRPYIAYDPGMARDALAYYGCAELFQDVHSELIQHKRAWMMKRRMLRGQLSVNSQKQRAIGFCPLMPEEVGILLRAYGYQWDSIIYVAGGEVFGGQRTLIPLHAMFENVIDRTLLTTAREINRIYGREVKLEEKGKLPSVGAPPVERERKSEEAWRNGPRPRQLPPPPQRPKYYNIEGWWGWVAESDNEPESTVMELRTNAHKLLWEAIDYFIAVEADVFVGGFDRDGKGHCSFGSLVAGHRLYRSPSMKTFRLKREEMVKLIDENSEHRYQANQSWVVKVRRSLRKGLVEGVKEGFRVDKNVSFLSHPVPECSCLRHDVDQSEGLWGYGEVHGCPRWMEVERVNGGKEKDADDENDVEDDVSEMFFKASEIGEMGKEKEESQLDDQEELEGDV